MNLSIFVSIFYTIGWFWCVLFGINSQTFIAVAGAIFLLSVQLYYIKKYNQALYIQDFLLAFFSIFLGIILEFFLMQSSVINYVNYSKIFPPIWIILLYPQFSILINHSLKIIKKNYIIAFLFGFFGAPLSYIAGQSLGGLSFSFSMLITWLAIGVLWGLFLCVLSKIANIIEVATKETLEDSKSESHINLLYDGDCPLCEKEICFLKKRANDNLKFIDIAAEKFVNDGYENIDYDTAMSQIHAVDSQGNVFIGLNAFAKTYARSHLLILSTLMRLPFMKIILNPMYEIFAKKRLWLTGRTKMKKNQ